MSSKATERLQVHLRIKELLNISKALNNYQFNMVPAAEKYTTDRQRKVLKDAKTAATKAIKELIDTERTIRDSLHQEFLDLP